MENLLRRICNDQIYIFRALTLLGLTFVLIGCGAADPGEGGTGTPGTGPVTQADLEKIEGSIKDMIQNAKGSINTSNGHAVAMKIISILKASQPNGSCSFFGVDGLAGTKDEDIAAGTIATIKEVAAYIPYKVNGKDFGGSGSSEINAKKTFAAVDQKTAAATGKLAKDAVVIYTYKKFSLDGKYFLDGELVLKNGAAAGEEGGMKTVTIDADKNTLKLFEGETEIATIEFDKAISFTEIKVSETCKAPEKTYAAEISLMPLTTKVTVKGAGFTDIEMSVSKIAVTKKNRTQGKNIDMLWALLGPQNPAEIDLG